MRAVHLMRPHSEARYTRVWTHPTTWIPMVQCASPRGEARGIVFAAVRRVQDGGAISVTCSRVAPALELWAETAMCSPWRRAVGTTEGPITARSKAMGKVTDTIKEGMKDTARAVKRGAEKVKDAAVRGVDKSKDAAVRTAEKVRDTTDRAVEKVKDA